MKNELIIIDDDLPFRSRLSTSMEKKGFNVESFGDFKKSFKSKNRLRCAPPAPAQGLYLVDVKY